MLNILSGFLGFINSNIIFYYTSILFVILVILQIILVVKDGCPLMIIVKSYQTTVIIVNVAISIRYFNGITTHEHIIALKSLVYLGLIILGIYVIEGSVNVIDDLRVFIKRRRRKS